MSIETVRWGIVGPGSIANNLVRDLALVPNATLTAVGSRSAERAQAFIDDHADDEGASGTPIAYGSYDELIHSPEVDVLYIATPHAQHQAIAEAALAAGKHLLVEKAFTATLDGTMAIVEAARKHDRFVMEAMWTRFLPAIVKIVELVDSGAIGEVRGVQADLCLGRPFQAGHRLFEPSTAGGALLDLGVYPVSLAQYFLGDPESVVAAASHYDNGVDASTSIQLGYSDGLLASLYCSIENAGPGRAAILGTEGWIEIPPRFHHPDRFIVHHMNWTGRADQHHEHPPIGGGYYHELVEVTESIRAGRTESAIMPLSDTVSVMKILQACADQVGLSFTEDPQIPR
ncbi:Gfo/Idh/MocA family protein [Naumannella halotolerans]|uniref:Putative dehydrogenase n=1 Tax=Naumannella halotolerans TaxID=993414 RepID=A0A4V3EMJ3_9ACTN|nr:Gfo/Idh/MocA family oxidoreductase [Naumannella halotolerans]TDT29848.1 putative dehydrogenase [Naumannella halotolerans]